MSPSSSRTPTHADIRADGSRSTATDVLTKHELWDAITALMPGYPLAVNTLLQDTTLHVKLDQAESAIPHATYHFVGALTRRGLLPHLAIAANDASMLRTLFRLAKHLQYARDPRFNFRKSMRCAVLLQRVDVLECLEELKRSDDPENKWTWQASEPNLMRLALQRPDADTRVLDWLFKRLPPVGTNRLFVKDMAYHAKAGDLAIITWLLEHACKVKHTAIEGAAQHNQPHTLAYLFQLSSTCQKRRWILRDRCQVMRDAARVGYVDVVRVVLEQQQGVRLSHKWEAIYEASHDAHLPVIKLIVESVPLPWEDTAGMMDVAAERGHFDVVQYLHEHLPDSGSESTMGVAAAYGHLDIVRFLHENRFEGCRENALTAAAQNGHIAVVRFLREYYPHLQCSPSAVDRVAASGNLELLTFLYDSFDGLRCTEIALTAAAKSGHEGVIAFLLQHQAEGSISDALLLAATNGHVEVVKLLHASLGPNESTFTALEIAARRRRYATAQFLCEDESREPSSFLKQTVDTANIALVRGLLRYASLAQLEEGREYALQQNSTAIATLLTRVLDARRDKVMT